MKNKEEIKERIEYLENAIKNMRSDEEIFGLVNEDRAKINEWIKEISLLNIKKLKGGTSEK